MDTTASLLSRVAQEKQLQKTAFTAAGIDVSDLPFEQYHSKIKYDTKWHKDPLWWDIADIVGNMTLPEGYVAAMGFLADDDWQTSTFCGADAYITSDGAFYEVPSQTTLVTHNWLPSAYKPDSRGYATKYGIRLYKSTSIITPNFGNGTATASKWIGCWLIGAFCRNGTVAASNYFSNNYSLVFYGHMDCRYSGATLNGFFGGNSFCLSELPDDWNFTSNITAIGTAFQSRVIKRLDVSSVNFSNVTTFSSVLANMFLVEKIEGVIDCSKVTTFASFLSSSYMLKEITLRNVSKSLSFASSVMSEECVEDIIINGLVDLTGQAAQTLTISNSQYFVGDGLRARATAKNWVVA